MYSYGKIVYVLAVHPVEVTSHPSVDTAFHNLANILDNHDGQYDMPYGHRYILTAWSDQLIPYMTIIEYLRAFMGKL